MSDNKRFIRFMICSAFVVVSYVALNVVVCAWLFGFVS